MLKAVCLKRDINVTVPLEEWWTGEEVDLALLYYKKHQYGLVAQTQHAYRLPTDAVRCKVRTKIAKGYEKINRLAATRLSKQYMY